MAKGKQVSRIFSRKAYEIQWSHSSTELYPAGITCLFTIDIQTVRQRALGDRSFHSLPSTNSRLKTCVFRSLHENLVVILVTDGYIHIYYIYI